MIKLNIEFLKTNLIAHRGYHNKEKGIIENSIEAFKKAIKCGYTIELDVHMLKSGEIVVFHDENLKRVCGINKNINDCTYEDIKDLKLFNTDSKIPLLSDVLKLINGKVPIIIEIKYNPKYGKLEKELLKLLKEYNGLYAFISFYPKTICYLKKHTKVPVGLLSSDFKKTNTLKSLIGKTLLLDIILKADFISFDIRALPNNFVSSKRKSKLVLGWTVRNKEDYEKSIKYCDNLVCENMKDYRV